MKSLKEVIATARKEPGKLTYASYGAGHISHLMGEMFKSYAGVDILHVPYKSSPLPDVIAGRVDFSSKEPRWPCRRSRPAGCGRSR